MLDQCVIKSTEQLVIDQIRENVQSRRDLTFEYERMKRKRFNIDVENSDMKLELHLSFLIQRFYFHL